MRSFSRSDIRPHPIEPPLPDAPSALQWEPENSENPKTSHFNELRECGYRGQGLKALYLQGRERVAIRLTL
jgi:hypothetical protein